MYIYLPVALTSINMFLPFMAGFGVGVLSGLFGVGGGWLMTPLLMMMGISPVVAAATDANQIVAASASGCYAHWRIGNVDFKLGIHLLIGSFTGGLIGVQVVKVLRALGNADVLIKISYVIMLGIIGTLMFIESLSALKKKKNIQEEAPSTKNEKKINQFLKNLPFQTYYSTAKVNQSMISTILLGLIVGLLAAIMGVGGGFLMVPVMVYLLEVPMHVVVGTSLFIVLFTCIEVTILQSVMNHAVDIILAILLFLGSTIGAQIGASIGSKLRGEQLRIILASIILIVTIKMILDLTLTPSIFIAPKGGH
ncbi:MAG: sulfite exporter TauE/SafE family protein [Caldimicrobium thiodismutans]